MSELPRMFDDIESETCRARLCFLRWLVDNGRFAEDLAGTQMGPAIYVTQTERYVRAIRGPWGVAFMIVADKSPAV